MVERVDLLDCSTGADFAGDKLTGKLMPDKTAWTRLLRIVQCQLLPSEQSPRFMASCGRSVSKRIICRMK